MWELDHKESWASKNWCLWIVVLEKTLESPLDCKEIKLVNPKGNQSWIFIGRTDAKAEAPILWPPDVKNWLLRKDPDAGKDWRQEEKGATEDEIVGWHHWLNGHEFEQAQELVMDREAWRAAVHGHKELDTTEWTELICIILHFFIFHFKCEKVQKWIPTRCSTSFPSCEAPARVPRHRWMFICLWLSSACSSFQEGVRPSEMEGGSGERGRRTSPGAKGALPVQPAVLLTCLPAYRPVPAVGFRPQRFPDKTVSPTTVHTDILNIFYFVFVVAVQWLTLIPFCFGCLTSGLYCVPGSKSWVFLFVSTHIFRTCWIKCQAGCLCLPLSVVWMSLFSGKCSVRFTQAVIKEKWCPERTRLGHK